MKQTAKRSLTRLFACFLLVCLLAMPLLSSCVNKDATNESPSLRVTDEDTLTLSFSPAAELLREHRGQTVSVYELASGETVDDLHGRFPVATGKLTDNTKIKIPLNDRDKLYSRFLPVVSGKHATDAPIGLTAPSSLASLTADFPRANSIKGLNAADEELSRALYSAHTLVSLSASALTSGDGAVQASLAGVEVALDSSLLAETDAAVRSATETGTQVSLSLLTDAALSVADYTAILEFLAARYVDGECGFVSAFLIGSAQERTEENDAEAARDADFAAALLRSAEIALTSRYSNGRVYLTVGGEPEAVISYLSLVKTTADALSCQFGVALTPDCSYPQREDRLSIFSLDADAKAIRSSLGRNARIAVVGISFPADDADLQAALCTYAYRASMNVKADLMIYSAQTDGASGLYSDSLMERPAARAFRLLETDANTEGERLAASLLTEEWEALKAARTARLAVTGIANVGAIEERGDRLIDFSNSAAPIFSLAGKGYAPAVRHSESLGVPVLTATLNDSSNGIGSGFRSTLSDLDQLKGDYVLSTRLLPQASPDFPAKTATVTLLLDGTSEDGQALTYSSFVSVSCGSWQSLTFQIREFTERMDPSAPVTLSLLMRPDYEALEAPNDPSGEESALPHFALWLHSVDVREAAPDHTLPTVLSLVLLGFVVALCLVLLFRRRRAGAPKRRI